MTSRGTYLVIEGTDGTGKSTQVERLAARLEARGIETVQFHEPDGVEIASELRKIIKNGDLERTALTNVLLFTAARRENWLQQGKPALERGAWLLSARNYLSTDVFQGYGEGVPIWLIHILTRIATGAEYMRPDFEFILDIQDEAERARRIQERGELKNPDTFESRGDDFQQALIAGYRRIAKRRRIPLVSASQPIDAITEQLWRSIERSINR